MIKRLRSLQLDLDAELAVLGPLKEMVVTTTILKKLIGLHLCLEDTNYLSSRVHPFNKGQHMASIHKSLEL